MDETAANRDDIVSLLVADHETIRRSFEALAGGTGSERATAFACLERFRPDTTEFATTPSQLPASVSEHADLEERHVLRLMSEEQRADVGRRYCKARSSGPTHPHPSAPDTPPGNLVAGPVAALFDRIRDAAHHV